MFRVRRGIVVDLVEHPSSRVISVMTNVESPAPPIADYGFAGVMKQCLFELCPHLRTDRHQNENNVHHSMLRVGRVLFYGPGETTTI